MRGWPVRLDLFGAIHYDSVGKVQRELSPLIEKADAICIEAPERLSAWTYLVASAKAPLAMAGAMTLDLLLFLLLALGFNRDFRATEDIAVQRLDPDVPVYRVDRHPVELLARTGPMSVIANWSLLGGLVVYAPIGTAVYLTALVGCWAIPVGIRRLGARYPGVILGVLGISSWYALLLAGFVLPVVLVVTAMAYWVLVYWSLHQRNEHMLDRTQERAREHEHEQIVLITGKAHLWGMVQDARERGLSIGSVHVSRWLRGGRTYDSVAPTAESDNIEPTGVGALPKLSLRKRVAVWLTDTLAIILFCSAFLIALVSRMDTSPGAIGFSNLLIAYGGIVTIALGYRIGSQIVLGGTPGERLLQLSVVDFSGEPVEFTTSVVRHCFWLVDTVLLFVPALLDDQNRMICDHITGTDLVKRKRDG